MKPGVLFLFCQQMGEGEAWFVEACLLFPVCELKEEQRTHGVLNLVILLLSAGSLASEPQYRMLPSCLPFTLHLSLPLLGCDGAGVYVCGQLAAHSRHICAGALCADHQQGEAQHGTAQHCTALHRAVQCST